MNEETKEALEGAIDKWQKIVDFLKNARSKTIKWADLYSIELGRVNCPLCHDFMSCANGACTRCPVTKKTGRKACKGTPYTDWSWIKYGKKLRLVRHWAKKELEFLISLRE